MENNAIVEISGFGLKKIEDNLGFFDKEYSENVNKMSIIDKPMQSISETIIESVQRRRYSTIYNEQHNNLSWFERNVYINNSKEHTLAEYRHKEADKYSPYIHLGIFVAGIAIKTLIPYFINKNEKYNLTKAIYQLLTYTANIDGKISESNSSIIVRVMLDMPTSESARKKIKQLPIPSSISDIELTKSVYEFKNFIGWSLFRILRNNGCTDKDILDKKRHIFEIINISSYHELKYFLEDSKDEYKQLSIENNKFQNVLYALIDQMSASFNLSKKRRIETAMQLSSYDTYKENRELSQKILKSGALIVKDIILGSLANGNVVGATAYALAKNLLDVDVIDKDSYFSDSYEKIFIRSGLEKNEAIAMIDQGERLYKSTRTRAVA